MTNLKKGAVDSKTHIDTQETSENEREWKQTIFYQRRTYNKASLLGPIPVHPLGIFNLASDALRGSKHVSSGLTSRVITVCSAPGFGRARSPFFGRRLKRL